MNALSKTLTKNKRTENIINIKLREGGSLALLTAFSSILLFIRLYLSGSTFFVFLLWNLFLAFVPWAISTSLLLFPKVRRVRSFTVFASIMWMLFFPNAPYIFTDLFHLKIVEAMPLWFDLVLILSFAWTGLLFGLFSLRDMILLAKPVVNRGLLMILTGIFMYLTSFGIYVGRYLRWNSWDIVSRPHVLVAESWEIITQPFDHPRAWGMTLVLGSMLNIIYWTFKGTHHQKN